MHEQVKHAEFVENVRVKRKRGILLVKAVAQRFEEVKAQLLFER
jgi:hypothetical protein